MWNHHYDFMKIQYNELVLLLLWLHVTAFVPLMCTIQQKLVVKLRQSLQHSNQTEFKVKHDDLYIITQL